MSRERYRRAGVDLDRAEALIERLKPHVNATAGPGFRAGASLEGFGGEFVLGEVLAGELASEWVLVSATDGVGTKTLLAEQLGSPLEWIGRDCVAMCANDVLVTGAKPLFFLDYISMHRLDLDALEAIVSGISEACRELGCALIGGESAELPGSHHEGSFEVVGSCVGGGYRGALWRPKERVEEGDVVLALASSGFHSNGYSLLRGEIEAGRLDVERELEGGVRVGEALVVPTRLYGAGLDVLRERFEVRGAAHITGGGIARNVARILPDRVSARLHRGGWEVSPVFREVMERCELPFERGLEVFNMGVGCVAIVSAASWRASGGEACLREVSGGLGYRVWEAGEIVSAGAARVCVR